MSKTEIPDSIQDFLDYLRKEAAPVIESDLQDAGILFDFGGASTRRILESAIARLVQAYRSGESVTVAAFRGGGGGWLNEFDEASLAESCNSNHTRQSRHQFQSDSSSGFAEPLFIENDLGWEQGDHFQSMQPFTVADEDLAELYDPFNCDNTNQGKATAPAYLGTVLARSRPKG